MRACNSRPPSSFQHTAITTLACLLLIFVVMPATGWAAAPDDFEGEVCGFMGKVKGLLNLISIAVVTIAVIFAGYQIAFAHKRIADVAPILIGGVLIGAAGQLATLLIGDDASDCTAAVIQALAWRYA